MWNTGMNTEIIKKSLGHRFKASYKPLKCEAFCRTEILANLELVKIWDLLSFFILFSHHFFQNYSRLGVKIRAVKCVGGRRRNDCSCTYATFKRLTRNAVCVINTMGRGQHSRHTPPDSALFPGAWREAVGCSMCSSAKQRRLKEILDGLFKNVLAFKGRFIYSSTIIQDLNMFLLS